jgi:hypothetical protein
MRWDEFQALVVDSFMAREKDSGRHAVGEQQREGDNKGEGAKIHSIIVHKVRGCTGEFLARKSKKTLVVSTYATKIGRVGRTKCGVFPIPSLTYYILFH